MIEPLKTYKHVNGRDAAIYVAMITKQTPDAISAVVHWVNIASQAKYIMGQEEITIKTKDLKNWKPYEVKFNEQI